MPQRAGAVGKAVVEPRDEDYWAHEMRDEPEQPDMEGGELMDRGWNSNLEHVLLHNCMDPDCEIHNIVAAAEEIVLTETELAYWFAGAMFEAEHPGQAGLEVARALEALRFTHQRLDAEAEKLDESLNPGQRTAETDLLEDR